MVITAYALLFLSITFLFSAFIYFLLKRKTYKVLTIEESKNIHKSKILFLIYISCSTFCMSMLFFYSIYFEKYYKARVIYIYDFILVLSFILIFLLILFFINIRNKIDPVEYKTEFVPFITAAFAEYFIWFLMRNEYSYNYNNSFTKVNIAITIILSLVSYLLISLIRVIQSKKIVNILTKIKIGLLTLLLIGFIFICLNSFVPNDLTIKDLEKVDFSTKPISSIQLDYIMRDNINITPYRNGDSTLEGISFNWSVADGTYKYKLRNNIESDLKRGKYISFGANATNEFFLSDYDWVGFPFSNSYNAYMLIKSNDVWISIYYDTRNRRAIDFKGILSKISDRITQANNNIPDAEFNVSNYKKVTYYNLKDNVGKTTNVLEAIDNGLKAFAKNGPETSTVFDTEYNPLSYYQLKINISVKYDKLNSAWLVEYKAYYDSFVILNKNGDVISSWQEINKNWKAPN